MLLPSRQQQTDRRQGQSQCQSFEELSDQRPRLAGQRGTQMSRALASEGQYAQAQIQLLLAHHSAANIQ
ncbi:hypothetical protein D3C78_1415670 [compost metagenome]